MAVHRDVRSGDVREPDGDGVRVLYVASTEKTVVADAGLLDAGANTAADGTTNAGANAGANAAWDGRRPLPSRH